MRRLPALLLAACALVTASGCGNEPAPTPDTMTPAAPRGTEPVRYRGAGLALEAPVGWQARPGRAPLITAFTSGQGSVAILRYPRVEPLPRTRAELDAATDQLVAAATARDASFRELRRSRTRVDGARAIVLRGTERVGGQLREVRSTHIFSRRAEVVVDAFAPPAHFPRVDAQVFRPLLRSLELSRPRA
jgi:hypothetical protein